MTLRFGILTVSDRVSTGQMDDRGGAALAERLAREAHEVARTAAVADESDDIVAALTAWADEDHLDVILTTGGTGMSLRDVTPEATLSVCNRLVPGIAEEMRRRGLEKTPYSMISRAAVGLRGTTLIINLPGSPAGAIENLEVVLPVLDHAIATLHGGKH